MPHPVSSCPHADPTYHPPWQAAKSRDQEGSGSQHFSELMAGFHAGAAEDFRELEVGGCPLPPLLLLLLLPLLLLQ